VIVRSFGSVESLTSRTPAWTNSGGSLAMYGAVGPQTYLQLYRSQPNVRICVDFLARNFAQLGLHVFRRVSDTDRVRLADHDVANWTHHPNPGKTRFRLFEDLMTDMGVFFNAYWLKVRTEEALGLVRLPPEEMTVEGQLIPTAFVWTVDGKERRFAPSEIVHFSGYLMGISPLETLRQVLAEQKAASDFREAYWTHGARFEGIITVEKDAPAARWNPTQKNQFRSQWQEFASTGARAGQIPVLPPGMDVKQTSFNAKDSQYLDGVKLSREVCAAAYHIPQPMVGILDHATFSNVREQHKHLYQDCLGPWLVNIAEELERQLLIESRDTANVYLEFNIAEKLSGSFEEQANALQVLVGRPIMTANEGRARLNLPSIKDDESAERLAAQQGGPSDASAQPPGAGDAPATEEEAA
jgi:HK97 family phage portal protein